MHLNQRLSIPLAKIHDIRRKCLMCMACIKNTPYAFGEQYCCDCSPDRNQNMSDFVEEQRQLFKRFKQINLDRDLAHWLSDLARHEQMNLDKDLARLEQINFDRDLALELDGELNKRPEDNEHNKTRYIRCNYFLQFFDFILWLPKMI